MNNTKIKVSELKKGQQFKTKYGTYECTRAYWAGARNPAYRAMCAVVVASTVEHLKPGSPVGGWKHNETVELI